MVDNVVFSHALSSYRINSQNLTQWGTTIGAQYYYFIQRATRYVCIAGPGGWEIWFFRTSTNSKECPSRTGHRAYSGVGCLFAAFCVIPQWTASYNIIITHPAPCTGGGRARWLTGRRRSLTLLWLPWRQYECSQTSYSRPFPAPGSRHEAPQNCRLWIARRHSHSTSGFAAVHLEHPLKSIV